MLAAFSLNRLMRTFSPVYHPKRQLFRERSDEQSDVSSLLIHRGHASGTKYPITGFHARGARLFPEYH